jgi:hypothetical protein
MAMLLAGESAGRAQAAVAGAQAVAGGGGTSAAAERGTGQPVPAADSRTEKQKALARQTERLFDMATELKAEVDKTNKNILSLKVVAKAEEIEALAKGMRGQLKK